MRKNVKKLCAFLDASPSVYHAADNVARELEAAGYTRLSEGGHWRLTPGGKYYVTRGGTSVMAFRLPEGTPDGFMLTAAHSDRPTFKIKENGFLTGTYTRLSTEKYGGMLIAPWLDRPLSIAGRVMVQTESGVRTSLVNIDRDLLLIPNVAIHMNRKANDGYSWNVAVDTLPLLGGKNAEEKLRALLCECAGGEVLGHDLTLYIRQRASVWGMEEEFISAAALDDLGCVFCALEGFLQAKSSRAVPVLCVFDSEEVGSASLQGAASDVLSGTLHRICTAMGWEKERMLHNSFLLSADNAHAVHPNHPEYADPKNAPVVNEGVVLKFNANQRYTTDGVSAALFRTLCRRAGVKVQTYCNRADIPGGSTLGNISLSQVSVLSADIGLPQLAMHSCYETAGVQDVDAMVSVLKCFYESALYVDTEQTYTI